MPFNSLAALLTVALMVAVIVLSEYHLVPGRASRKGRYIIYFVLTMMASMFLGLIFYLLNTRNFLNTVIAINIVMVPMISAIVLLVYLYSMEFRTNLHLDRAVIPAIFVINEFLMTIFVVLLTGGSIPPGPSGIPNIVNSVYFVLPMEIEMLFSIALFKFKGSSRSLLIILAMMDIVSPAVFPAGGRILLFANAFIMVAGMVISFEVLAKSRTGVIRETRRIIDLSLLIYFLNSLGFFIYYSQGIRSTDYWLPYSLSVAFGMAVYFFLVISGRSSEVTKGWGTRKIWLFYTLSIAFIAEMLMSIPLDIAVGIFTVSGSGASAISFLVRSSVSDFFVGSTLASVIPFIAAVANAPMFLLLMGVEMGSLVVFRMRRIKWAEKRLNLALALLAYFTYTLLGPNYVSGWDRLPLWANVGALGPVGGVLILPLILSYALYAVLAVLFGRRSYCSTLCPSAVMYGGTLGEEMVKLNYSSKISKKNIGSRYSSLAMRLASISWIFLVASSVASFAAYEGLLRVKFDAAVLYSFLVWNLLWYLFFISIPFLGMSPCRRYGWCTTGTFVGFFSNLGFFKIKGVDPEVCYRCDSKACVTACEVGLGDIPAQIMKKGYFKSQKCVGSGSCIMACPYHNIYFYDVRNAIRGRLGSKSPGTQ
ncbi:MAG: 4Fe-4S binding protein [Thermoplasmata archaeon]